MYSLASTEIRRPTSMKESNSTQMAVNRTLDGSVNRDFFGSNKRVWTITFNNLNTDDYNTINTIYQNYLSTKMPVAFSVTEDNYSLDATVHVDFQERDFSIPGSDYLSDNTLVLTEA